MKYAGFWIRLLAAILDTLVIGIPLFLAGFLADFVTGLHIFYYLAEAAYIVIVVFMNSRFGGTPGKLMLGLRIVDGNGRYMNIETSILRYVCGILSGLILFIGYLMIVWDRRKQGLHDRLARTFVVRSASLKASV